MLKELRFYRIVEMRGVEGGFAALACSVDT